MASLPSQLLHLFPKFGMTHVFFTLAEPLPESSRRADGTVDRLHKSPEQ